MSSSSLVVTDVTLGSQPKEHNVWARCAITVDSTVAKSFPAGRPSIDRDHSTKVSDSAARYFQSWTPIQYPREKRHFNGSSTNRQENLEQ